MDNSKSKHYFANHLFPLLLTADSENALNAKYEVLNKISINDTEIEKLVVSLAGDYNHSCCYRGIVIYNKNKKQLTLAFKNKVKLQSNSAEDRPIAFMFTGVGGHYINMAKGLYQNSSIFKETFNYCCDFSKPLIEKNLKEVLYPDIDSSENYNIDDLANNQYDFKKIFNKSADDTKEKNLLSITGFLHPLLFIIEYSISQLLIKWGIIPQFLIGHSVGEYVAATVAGALSLEDALILITRRSQLIEQLPYGAMVTVLAGKDDLTSFFKKPTNLFLAAENSPVSCTISGLEKDIIKFETELDESNIAYLRLSTDRAFHSPLLQSIRKEFVNIFDQIKIDEIKIPFLSNLTGNWTTNSQVINSNNWFLHTTNTVCFSAGIKKLLNIKDIILVEVGPGQILTGFAFQHKLNESNPRALIVSALKNANDAISDNAFLLNMLGKLWVNGVNINWRAVFNF